MRGQALLVIAIVFVNVVVEITVYLLKTFTTLSGGMIFLLTTIIAIVAFVLYSFLVTKMGY
jgi:hypothetical protein